MTIELSEVKAALENTIDTNTIKALKATLKTRVSKEEKTDLSVREALDLFLVRLGEIDNTIDTEAFFNSNRFVTAWTYFYTPYTEASVVMSFHA